jgi:hypothetical protein
MTLKMTVYIEALTCRLQLSSWDGVGRQIAKYNGGNDTTNSRLAAEEYLTVIPICPDETAQSEATWDVTALAGVLGQVLATFDIDTKRVSLGPSSLECVADDHLLP